MKLYIVILSLFIAGCSSDAPRPEEKIYVHLYDRNGIYKTYTTKDLFVVHGVADFIDADTGERLHLMGNIMYDRTP